MLCVHGVRRCLQRRVHSLPPLSPIRPPPSLSPLTLTPHPPPPYRSSHPSLTRSFARLPPELQDDDDEAEMDDVDEAELMGEDGELAEEAPGKAETKLSKAERLRLKEKEKRRAKLAEREAGDVKKRNKAQQRGRGASARRGFAPVLAPVVDEDAGLDVVDVAGDDVRVLREERLQRDDEEEEEEEEDGEGEEGEEEEGDDERDPRPLNEAIRADVIVLIDPQGKRVGRVAFSAALAKARQAGLDLLQLSPPQVTPPICRVVNYAEFYYAEQIKRQRALGLDAATLSQRTKTVRLRKVIDPHDLSIKVQAMRGWLKKGWSVRVVYFERAPVEEERLAMMQSVQRELDGLGVAADLHTKTGQVLFEPDRGKKGKAGGGGGKDRKDDTKGDSVEAQVVTTRVQQQQSSS